MKTLCFNRNRILRAIRIACYALFLAASAHRAQAQTVTAPFVNTGGNIYVTTTPYAGPGTFYDPYGVYSVTVNNGTVITNTTASHGAGTQYDATTTDIATGGGTFTNNGSISQSITSPTTHYYSAVALYGSDGGTDTTLTNAGTISSYAGTTGGQGSTVSAAGVSYDNSDNLSEEPSSAVGDFSVTVNNSGTISGSASGYAFGMHLEDAGAGTQTVNNTGTISGTSSANYATGLYAHALGSSTGSIFINNGGIISAVATAAESPARGIDAETTSGNITVAAGSSGTGTISATSSGDYATAVFAQTQTGAITIDSPSAITATTTSGGTDATGITARTTSLSAAGATSIDLSGALTVSGYDAGTGVNASNVTGAVSFTSTGTITVTAGQAAVGLLLSSSDSSASVTLANSMAVTSNASTATGIDVTGSPVDVTVGSSLTATGIYDTFGIHAVDNGSGDLTITDSAGSSVSATSLVGPATGIYAHASEGGSANVVISNGSPITVIAGGTAYGMDLGSNNGNITVSTPAGGNGAISVTSSGGSAEGIAAHAADGGTVTITQPQSVSASGYAGGIAIGATTTSGAITLNSSGTVSSYSRSAETNSSGLVANTATGVVTINATGNITSSGFYSSADGINVNSTGATGAGAIQVTTSGTISSSSNYHSVDNGINVNSNSAAINIGSTSNITATSENDVNGINASSNTGAITINSTGTLGVTTNGGLATGIYGQSSAPGAGAISVTNSGAVTASGYYSATAVGASSQDASITIHNSGVLGTTSTYGAAQSIFASTNSGSVTIANQGTITASGYNGTSAGIYAITVGNGTTGNDTVSNTASITATSSTYEVDGIHIFNGGTGSSSVTNSGSLYVTGDTGTNDGILVANTGDVTVANSGAISVTSTGSAGYNVGMNLFGANVTVSNSANITASVTTGTGSAYGIYVGASGNVSVTNSANATIASSSGYDSEGIEVYAGQAEAGSTITVANQGKVSATSGSGYAFGVDVYTGSGAVSVTNSGLVSASGYEDTYGVYAQSVVNQPISVTNTGEIDGSNSGSGYTAYGVYVQTGGNVTVSNTGGGTNTFSDSYGAGVISASGNRDAGGEGVFVNAGGTASISNSGTITGGASQSGNAFGIDATSSGDLTVTNSASGTISASGNYGSATGISAILTGTGDITITNAGSIQASLSQEDHPGGLTVSGIYAHNAGSIGNITVSNTGSINANSGYGYGATYDINAVNDTTGSVSIMVGDGSNLTSHSSYASAYGVQSSTHGAATIAATSGSIIYVTAPGGKAYGMSSSGNYGTTVTAAGTITAIGLGASGIQAFDQSSLDLTNTGSIAATATTGSAYGIQGGSNDGSVTLANSGTVSAAGTGSSEAAAIFGSGFTQTTITNSGTATATNVDGEADAIVIAAENDDADVTNSGTATATATGGGNAYGVNVQVGDTISIINTSSGNITANANSGMATGIESINFDTGSESVTLSNAGSVTASSTQGAAFGINSGSNANGAMNVTNTSTGVITVNASSQATGTESALYGGTLTYMNAGTITATGTNGNGVGADFNGASSDFVITNSGSITAESTGFEDGAFDISGGTNGNITVTNTGSLTATEMSGDSAADGISMGCEGNISINNSGTISATSTAVAYGIDTGNGGDMTVTNSGTITVAAGSTGNATGIDANLGGNFTFIGQHGTITVSGSSAYGIVCGTTGAATLSNSTSVTANAGTDDSRAFNISAIGAVTMNNTGTLHATSASGYATGIELSSSSDSVSLTTSGTITAQGGAGSNGIIEVTYGGADTISLDNSGSITATGSNSTYGVFLATSQSATGFITMTNASGGNISATGTSSTYSTYGVDIEGQTGGVSVTNDGSISATDNNGGATYGVYVDPIGPVALTNNGHITATGTGTVDGVDLNGDDGVAFTNNAHAVITATGAANTTTGVLINDTAGVNETLINNGTITSSGAGLIDLSAGDLLFSTTRGTLMSGNGHAFTLGTGSNTADIIGNSRIVGLMDGGATHLDNTINFIDIVITKPQQAQFDTVSGEAAANPTGNYTVMLGPESYNFTDFNFVNGGALIVSTFSNSVDSGLLDIARRLDNATTLPAGLNIVYLAAAHNPEATLNNFTAREYLDAYGTISLGDDAAFNELTDNRAFAIRSGTTGLDLSGLTLTSGSMIASINDTSNTLGELSLARVGGTEVLSDSKNMSEINPPDDKRWGAWVSGTVTLQDESDRFTSPGYKATTGSPTLGADYKLTHDLAVGALVHLWTTGANFGDGSRLGVETAFIGGYGTYSHDHWYANGLVGAGYSNFDNQRVTLSGAEANSSPTGNKIIANFSGGYDFSYAGWHASPIVGLQYDHIGVGGYTETGAGALDLTVGDENIDSLRTKLGFHIARDFNWMGCTFTPDLNASWYHEFLNTNRNVSEAVSGGSELGEFEVTTTKPDDDFAMIGVGLSATPAQLHHDVTIFTNYNAQVSNNYLAHTINGGVRIGF